MNPFRVALQFAVIAALFAAVATLSDWPVYRQIPEGKGVIGPRNARAAGGRSMSSSISTTAPSTRRC